MKTPSFWYRRSSSLASLMLLPFAALYETASGLNEAFALPQEAPIPVICLGNLVAGGSGKTPTAIAISKLVVSKNLFSAPMFVTRGYGGDEDKLLARHAPTIINCDRYAGAVEAHERGADVAILDDGLQNYTVRKDLTFCVIDGMMGFGNGKLIPAGPLRQSLENGFRGVDGVILIGEDVSGAAAQLPSAIAVFHAHIKADTSALSGSYVAFCGIGYPAKFRKTLEDNSVSVAAFYEFSDHYAFRAADIDKLAHEARRRGARLVTTEKDFVRLPDCPAKELIDVLPIEVVFDDPTSLLSFIKGKVAR